MSFRSSFVTEYIYCEKCFNACKEVLCQNDKYLKGVVIPSWQEGELPIIAGKIGGLSTNEEIYDMEFEYIPKIQEKMCENDTIRIVVVTEVGTMAIFEFDKNNVEIQQYKNQEEIEREKKVEEFMKNIEVKE